MSELLALFASVVGSPWFLRTSVILFLDNIDVFETKLPNGPLEKFFLEYTGGADINKVAKCILRRFMQANRAHQSVYPQRDTTRVKLVFAEVKETILQNDLSKGLGCTLVLCWVNLRTSLFILRPSHRIAFRDYITIAQHSYSHKPTRYILHPLLPPLSSDQGPV